MFHSLRLSKPRTWGAGITLAAASPNLHRVIPDQADDTDASDDLDVARGLRFPRAGPQGVLHAPGPLPRGR
jgi:hypothetical protein